MVVTERVVGMDTDIPRLAVAEAVVEDNVAALAALWAAMEHPVMDTDMIKGTAMTLPVTTHTVTEDTAPHTQDTEEPILTPPMVDTAPKRRPQPASRAQPEAKCAGEEERAEEAREAEEEVAGVLTKPIHNQAHVPISLLSLPLPVISCHFSLIVNGIMLRLFHPD